jgi:hypothetical protein
MRSGCEPDFSYQFSDVQDNFQFMAFDKFLYG